MQKPVKNKEVFDKYNEYESYVTNANINAPKRTPQIGDSTIKEIQQQTRATTNKNSVQASPFGSSSTHKQYYKDMSNTMMSESDSKSNSPVRK